MSTFAAVEIEAIYAVSAKKVTALTCTCYLSYLQAM